MSYSFLKSANDFQGEYLAVSEERIEALNVSDSYDQFGQLISPSDAGDYLIVNKPIILEVDFQDDALRYQVGQTVSAYQNNEAFDALVDEFEDGNEITIERTKFSGFNFWDGNNWQTISVDSVDGNNSHEIEDDEEIITRLNEAILNKEFQSEGFGTKTYRYKDAEITVSNFASNFEAYSITIDNELEEA